MPSPSPPAAAPASAQRQERKWRRPFGPGDHGQVGEPLRDDIRQLLLHDCGTVFEMPGRSRLPPRRRGRWRPIGLEPGINRNIPRSCDRSRHARRKLMAGTTSITTSIYPVTFESLLRDGEDRQDVDLALQKFQAHCVDKAWPRRRRNASWRRIVGWDVSYSNGG
jgi:hypothetical protein